MFVRENRFFIWFRTGKKFEINIKAIISPADMFTIIEYSGTYFLSVTEITAATKITALIVDISILLISLLYLLKPENRFYRFKKHVYLLNYHH
jgi:hypothetical protein